ncbi:MAG: 1-phosphofructokinase family hexose kinase [Limnohabitans sp.]
MPRFVTLTPNPALDVSTSVDKLVDAHKLRCAPPQWHPGGGGINVARVLHRLGGDVLAIYPAGGATGERLHGLLQAEGVPDLHWPITAETRESFTVNERDTGREYRFVLPGPALTQAEWHDGLDALRKLPPPAWVVASGSLPPGLAADGHAQIARVAREIGARMVVDSAGPALAAALAQGVWLVKPSLRELAELTGSALTTPDAQRQAARQLIARGQAQMVALSLGAEGAMLVTADECLKAQALSVPVAGSVGAGDSFLAGLLWALDAQWALPQALATAMAAGAAAVMTPGTALSQPQDVAHLRGQVRIQTC